MGDSKLKIIISQHARQRFSERWKHNTQSVEEVAEQVFRAGKMPSEKQMRFFTHQGFTKPGYWTSTYRVCGNYTFVYSRQINGDYVLKTLYSRKFRKKWKKKRK
jgi:hypothetical protein